MELTLYQSKENKYFAIYLSKYSYSVLENQLKSQKKKKKNSKSNIYEIKTYKKHHYIINIWKLTNVSHPLLPYPQH